MTTRTDITSAAGGGWTYPPPLLGCDPAAVQAAAAAALDEARAVIVNESRAPNWLLSEDLFTRHAAAHDVHPVDICCDPGSCFDYGHVVAAYAWFLLGASCVVAADTLPEGLHLSPEFLTNGDNVATGVIEALVMCAAAGARAEIPGTQENAMITGYAEEGQEVPAGMVEIRNPAGRRVFIPENVAPAALLTAAAVRADNALHQTKVDVAAELIVRLDRAGVIDIAQVTAAVVDAANRERDAAYTLVAEAFAMLARVYDTELCTDVDDTADAMPLLYMQTTAGQISRHLKPNDTANYPRELMSHRHANDVWDGHTDDERAERMAAVALGTDPDLVRELLERGCELTLTMVNGDPPINDPNNPDPGSPDYYCATMTDSGGNQIATGTSEYSHLIAITSMQLDVDRHAAGTEALGGWEGSNEPPF